MVWDKQNELEWIWRTDQVERIHLEDFGGQAVMHGQRFRDRAERVLELVSEIISRVLRSCWLGVQGFSSLWHNRHSTCRIKDRLLLAHDFKRLQPVVAWPCCLWASGTNTWQGVRGEGSCWPPHHGQKAKRNRKGLGSSIPFKSTPTVTFLPLSPTF